MPPRPPAHPALLVRQAVLRGGASMLRPRRPLVLADRVSRGHGQAEEAPCITEMSVMMACWKQNEFSDRACSQEIQAFFDCVTKAKVAHKQRILEESLGQSGRLTPKQVNNLLKRFPNITKLT